MHRRRLASNFARPRDGLALFLCILAFAARLAVAAGASHQLPYNVVLVLPQFESVNDKYYLTIRKARPVIDISVEDVVHKYHLMPDKYINFTYHDSRLWEADAQMAEKWATMGVVQAYCHGKLDAVLGFADPYSLATTAKISAAWGNGVPVITTTGLAAQMGSKKEFPFLTRMQGSYRQMADSIYRFIANDTSVARNESKSDTNNNNDDDDASLGYKHLVFMYHDKKRAINRPQQGQTGETAADDSTSSSCYFSLYAIKSYFMEKSEHFKEAWKLTTPAIAFDENRPRTPAELAEWLKVASEMANVIILCASPDTVREIMLAAHDLGMATSGEYVFINIDVSTGSHAEKPWLRQNDTNSPENERAKDAYKALKTISLRRSDRDEYKNFEQRVKNRAEDEYKYSKTTGKEYEMNNFISAFYDAVLLYAIALNETIAEGLDPRNGHNITSKMWNRTFVGITGNVSIDENGDRYSDYSLLDLDPDKDRFVEVAYYSGASNKLMKVHNFHWVGGQPPKDTPICGWDKSKCPDGLPTWAYMLIALASLTLIFIIVSFIIYRHYRLEAELAAMSWRIRWEELDGEEQKKEKKSKAKRAAWKVDGQNHPDQTEALLGRSNSRISLTSDKRSASSGATRKISQMLDRKFSLFTRKRPTGAAVPNNHSQYDAEQPLQLPAYRHQNSNSSGVDLFRPGDRPPSSPVPSQNNSTRKVSSIPEEDGDEQIELQEKKSFSFKNRKLSFGGLSMKSGGSVETIQMQNNAQIYTKTASYKGTVVAVKMLNIDPKKTPRLELSRGLLMELKKMKDLQHDHITRFTGACIDAPHYCIVTEYCPKGSLEDILENEKIELDKMMIYSLLHDLVKGMFFLHNSDIRSHGKLKSSNCVVDSRFVLKVTDFGLHKLHAMEETSAEEIGTHAFYKKKLWTAPELLREPEEHPAGTQKGDVYSFAIILHEMVYRKGVFFSEEESLEPQEIIERVVAEPDDPSTAFRPSMLDPQADEANELISDKRLTDLMLSCWNEDPHERPDFGFIRKVARSLNKNYETANLVDNLLKRMEQYANNLEGLVEERTRDYLEEKKKVEELLHQLLPPSVADQLISGRAVQAEAYDSVTIYFSDIVGFTALSSLSTPFQVVTLLNDLYLAFDGVVDNFKVYKVETIGDAYMVVSGLPERHDEHASQIAQMSIALLHKVKSFAIRHRPNEQLKLRIGMHSGPVVAGVVGSKMPRFCLFGDTVNTSSRMESNGLPLRIHVSSSTKEILDQTPGFHLELRGNMEMKGKGIQTTYWLKGYKDTLIPDFGPEYA